MINYCIIPIIKEMNLIITNVIINIVLFSGIEK